MASEHSKSSTSGNQEHLQPPPIAPYPPQQYNGHYPPPGAYPPYYAYAPISDANHDPNAPNGGPPHTPYLMPYPPPHPGIIYAYAAPPPGQGYPPFSPPPPPSQPVPRPKRKQVKMACTNCASACKRCDESRPCERCVKYGLSDSCRDGVRKERKKGIKRGPYKRKNRGSGSEPSVPGDPSAPPVPYPPPPEGYYHPYFYPPGYVQAAHDGQAHPEGVPNSNGQPMPHPQYYSVPPPMYPYPPYPGGPVPYAPPPVVAPTTSAAPATNGRYEHSAGTNEVNGDSAGTTKSKKRTRAKNVDEGGSKARKTKPSPAASQADGDAVRGKDDPHGGHHEGGSAFNGIEPRAMVAV
ncbi:hypothetical protein AcW1_009745 [Taiwanofungus camphoratus]|nr:hypothetical protein AcW1_009745 [Antrodia cinnamomea]